MDITLSDSDEDAPEHRPVGYAAPEDRLGECFRPPMYTGTFQTEDYFAQLPVYQKRPSGSKAYIPQWTDPGWNPSRLISGDGREEITTSFGNPHNDVYARPALLPSDVSRLPTQHALYVLKPAHFFNFFFFLKRTSC